LKFDVWNIKTALYPGDFDVSVVIEVIEHFNNIKSVFFSSRKCQ